jgi:hypothetical protein
MARTSWAVAAAETIMKRNPGTPGDVLADDGHPVVTRARAYVSYQGGCAKG